MITGKAESREVFVGGVQIHPEASQRLINHSPDGFNWGYLGSGPSQLALALLLYFTGNERYSLGHYQKLKFEIISAWPGGKNINVPNRAITNWIKKNGGIVATKYEGVTAR